MLKERKKTYIASLKGACHHYLKKKPFSQCLDNKFKHHVNKIPPHSSFVFPHPLCSLFTPLRQMFQSSRSFKVPSLSPLSFPTA